MAIMWVSPLALLALCMVSSLLWEKASEKKIFFFHQDQKIGSKFFIWPSKWLRSLVLEVAG